MSSFFQPYFSNLSRLQSSVSEESLIQSAQLMLSCVSKGGKVIVVGNGGSSAIAAHVTVDLTKNSGVRAINFNESDLITCFANDYGYELWVEKALGFYADKNDVVVLISSSGQSPNIVNAAKFARAQGNPVITLSGFKADNPLRSLGNVNFWVDSTVYNFVETCHQTWLLAIVDYLIEQKAKR